MVISCQSEINASLSARDVLNKNLQVLGVSQAYDYTDTVINMLVHNAVDVDHLATVTVTGRNAGRYRHKKIIAAICAAIKTIIQKFGLKYFSTGTEFWNRAVQAIDSAEKSVCVEFFIIGRGQLFNRVTNALERARARGAEIKIRKRQGCDYDEPGALNFRCSAP